MQEIETLCAVSAVKSEKHIERVQLYMPAIAVWVREIFIIVIIRFVVVIETHVDRQRHSQDICLSGAFSHLSSQSRS